MRSFCTGLFKQNRSVQNSNYFLPFDSASFAKLLDGVKGAAEVTAKDCLKVVFVLPSPSVPADVFLTVGTKWKSHVQMRFFIR